MVMIAITCPKEKNRITNPVTTIADFRTSFRIRVATIVIKRVTATTKTITQSIWVNSNLFALIA